MMMLCVDDDNLPCQADASLNFMLSHCCSYKVETTGNKTGPISFSENGDGKHDKKLHFGSQSPDHSSV